MTKLTDAERGELERDALRWRAMRNDFRRETVFIGNQCTRFTLTVDGDTSLTEWADRHISSAATTEQGIESGMESPADKGWRGETHSAPDVPPLAPVSPSPSPDDSGCQCHYPSPASDGMCNKCGRGYDGY